MFASLFLSLREGLEAALVIGIVLAALRKVGRSGSASAAWQGVVAAIAFSLLAGLGLSWLGTEFEGRGEQLFEGITMLIAALLLTWMIAWMRRESGNMQKGLEAGVARASEGEGSRWGIFWLSFLAVAREGLELVLFLAAVRMATDAMQTVLGAALGLAGAIALGWALFAWSKRLPLRQFFNVTNVVLIIFAAGLLARAVHEFNEAGIIPVVVEQVWNTNGLLDDSRPIGQLASALFGYNGSPSLTEVIAYMGYFVGAWALWKWLVPTKRTERSQQPQLIV